MSQLRGAAAAPVGAWQEQRQIRAAPLTDPDPIDCESVRGSSGCRRGSEGSKMCKKGGDVADTLLLFMAKLPWNISPALLLGVKLKMGEN